MLPWYLMVFLVFFLSSSPIHLFYNVSIAQSVLMLTFDTATPPNGSHSSKAMKTMSETYSFTAFAVDLLYTLLKSPLQWVVYITS